MHRTGALFTPSRLKHFSGLLFPIWIQGLVGAVFVAQGFVDVSDRPSWKNIMPMVTVSMDIRSYFFHNLSTFDLLFRLILELAQNCFESLWDCVVTNFIDNGEPLVLIHGGKHRISFNPLGELGHMQGTQTLVYSHLPCHLFDSHLLSVAVFPIQSELAGCLGILSSPALNE